MKDIDRVKEALSLFGLDFTVSQKDIKEAYKKNVAEYHPDKVSNLGKDLQNLAEIKTRRFKKEYQYLKKHYDPMPLEEVIKKLRERLANKYDKWTFGFGYLLLGWFIGLLCGLTIA